MDTIEQSETKILKELLEKYDEKEIYQKIIHYCLDLNANQVIVPFWDMMGCDASCRFNIPGQIGSPNWEYRLTSFDEFDSYLEVYANMIEKSHRKEG